MAEEPQATRPFGKSERRSACRVHCVVPLRISGTDSRGHDFSEPAHTEVITRDGGMIACTVSISAGAQITLQYGDKQAQARVVGAVRTEDECVAYGISFFVTPDPPFWDVKFEDRASESGVGRTLLECSHCRTSQVIELGEIELMVLESTRNVGLFCELCRSETLWRPLQLGDEALVTGSAAYATPTMQRQSRRLRTREQRRYPRIPMKRAQACIKGPGLEGNVVDVFDLSRGGLRFLSTMDYQPGTRVEVAVPYTHGGANIFVPAKIVRVISRARPGNPGDYACEYVKNQ